MMTGYEDNDKTEVEDSRLNSLVKTNTLIIKTMLKKDIFLQETIKHFENVKVAQCLFCVNDKQDETKPKHGCYEIDRKTIRYHHGDEGLIICDSIPDNATSYVVLVENYLDEPLKFAPIIESYPPIIKMIDNSADSPKNTFLDKQLESLKVQV